MRTRGVPRVAVLRRRAPGAGGAPGCLGRERISRRPAHLREDRASVDARCRRTGARARRRRLDALLGARRPPRGAAPPAFDVRALALIRETLAWHDGLADFAFAMQGLGSGAISLAGSRGAQAALPAAGRRGRGDRRLRAVRAGRRLGRRGHHNAARAATATRTCWTARRPGSPTAASPTSTACSRAPPGGACAPTAPSPRAASAPSSSTPTRRVSRSPSAST